MIDRVASTRSYSHYSTMRKSFFTGFMFSILVFPCLVASFQQSILFRRSYSIQKQNIPTTATIGNFRSDRTSLNGILDFFKNREDDFVRLSDSEDVVGPGPLILLYNVPDGIDDEEIQAMIEDGAPNASKEKGVLFHRIFPADLENVYQESTVADVLGKSLELAQDSKRSDSNNSESSVSYAHTPILYFSGISNSEMMKTYNIIAGEIYQETQGAAKAACAKVVTPALKKNFRQLFEEISGDHAEAMKTVDDGKDEA